MVSMAFMMGLAFGIFSIAAAAASYVCLIRGWCENLFGSDGVETYGVPLESRVPHIAEEQRSRRLRRVLRRALRRGEMQGRNGRNENGGDVILHTPSPHTCRSNSRWFRRCDSSGSETCTTLASSGVVYGHGRYFSPPSVTEPLPSPRSQLEGKSEREGEVQCTRVRQKEGRHARLRKHRRSSVDADGNHTPFGGWADSANSSSRSTDRSSMSASSGCGKTRCDSRQNAEVADTPQRRERQFATRISAMEQNAAMSGFFATPSVEWNREPY